MFVTSHALCFITDPSSQIYPIPFVSRSLDWLAWLAAPMVVDACSGVVAAADETSHAEARRAKPSQASQSRDRLTNGIAYICDDGSVIKHRAWLITNIQYQINPMT